MKESLYTFLWIFLTAFIGFNIVVFLDRKKLITPLEAIGLSFPLGIGVISVEMFIIGLFRAQLRTGLILTPWLVLIVYNYIFLRPYSKNKLSFKINPLSGPEKIIFSFLSFEVIYTFFRALIKPIESYDSVAIHALKSKMLYLAGTLPRDFFTQVANNFHGAHPDYPLLVPMSEAWFYVFVNGFNDFLVKSIFPLCFISFLIVFYSILKKVLNNRPNALLFTFGLASIAQFNAYATIGAADLLIGIMFCLSFLYLYLWMKNCQNRTYLYISLIFSILTLWAKNEGLLLIAITLTTLFLFLLRKGPGGNKEILIPASGYFLTIIAITLGWLGYGNFLGFVNENFNFSMISLKTFSSGLNRIPLILYEYQKHVFGFKKWNIIWIVLLVLLAARFKKSVKDDAFYITAVIFMFFIGYSLVYIMSTMDFNFLLTKTSSRFLLHILPVCIFWIACMTKENNY
ncbi:MAG: hypothetical protein KAU58_05955 [Candidatus Omnitrophica bacterium]|nr:hypothetical protein [Candidatus Omnitrophota bacterium]